MAATRRDFLRTATGLVAATAIGGGLIHSSADSAQAASQGGAIMNLSVHFGSFNGPFAARALQLGVEASVPSGGGGGAGAGKVSFDTVAIEKQVDGYSALLYMLSASGQHVERVQIAMSDAQGDPSGVIMLYGVRVLSCRSSFGGGGGADVAMEMITLNYSKIDMDMYGSKFGWDVAANKKLSS